MEIYVHVDRGKPLICGLACCTFIVGIILISSGAIDKDTGIPQILFGSLCLLLGLIGFRRACLRPVAGNIAATPAIEVATVNPIGQGLECSICMDKPRLIAFIPCGHSVCTTCSGELKACPLCRADIVDRLRLF